jgi:TET-Associated Glycosyltransferase
VKLPRYTVYVPSRSRCPNLTAKFLLKDGVPFKLVVEPQQQAKYAAQYGEDRLLVMDQNDGGLIYARNWIKAHSIANGDVRHWQLDDNISNVCRFWRNKKIVMASGLALALTEDFVERYTNVAIAGLNYRFFNAFGAPPFVANAHVYSCTLVLNSLPHRWRSKYNDDTDMCLQVLADGWCTILMNAFLVSKIKTMAVKGGNTPDYQGDGRLIMARQLERLWPGVVKTDRRYERPAHVVAANWKRFDTPLIKRTDLELTDGADEFGMELKQLAPIKSEYLAGIVGDRLVPGNGKV